MGFSSEQFELIELFVAKAGNDFSRCFYGTIKRLKSEDDSNYCFGRITVNNGFICARADTQEELGRKLDEMVLWVLDYESFIASYPSYQTRLLWLQLCA